MNRLISELLFYYARLFGGSHQYTALKASLKAHCSNLNSSMRWLRNAPAGEFSSEKEFREVVLFNTVFEPLQNLRNRFSSSPDLSETAGFELFAVSNAMRSYSQLFQDLWVLHETGGKRGGYFIEFGATNGRDISNTLLLEAEYAWNGILAEPNPYWHEALRACRTAAIDSRCIGPRTGEVMKLVIPANPEHAHTNAGSGLTTTPQIFVPTVSLNDLLEQHNAPKQIDFLSIDTEGSEFEILSRFDFSGKRRIQLVAVEHNFIEDNRENIFQLMTRHGYERVHIGYSRFDDWYRNKN